MNLFTKLLPRALLLSFVIKMLLTTPSISDAAIIFGLVSVTMFQNWLEKNKDVEDISNHVTKKLEEQTAVINKQNEFIQVMALEHAKMKTMLEGIKLKSDFKNNDGLASLSAKRAI